jgi:hypothetical protein
MHKEQQTFAVRLRQLHRLAQGLNVRITVLVRPSFQALDLPRKPLNLGQQVVEALLSGGELGVSLRMKNKL